MDENCVEDHRQNGDAVRHRVHKKPKMSPFTSDSDIVKEFSHHLPGFSRINNGSFGSCPFSIISSQRDWQLRFLQHPDDFYFNELKKGLLESRKTIQTLINASSIDEVSLVDNATTAAAIVLQRVHWGFVEGKFSKADSVVILHCAFQSVKKSIEAYVTRVGGSVIEVPLPFPVKSEEEIVTEFRKGIEKGNSGGRRVRLAIIDHITSMPCVLIPVKRLVRICKDEGVDHVFVDAAHAMGSVHVDVQEIGADYYVSNLHKWFFCPPSVAFLHCKNSSSSSSSPSSSYSTDLHHPVVSHEYGNGLASESSWIGTRDYSPQLVIPSVLDFVNRFEGGMEGIMRRNHEGVVKMGKMLSESWGTNLGSPPWMSASMVMVGLPSKLCLHCEEDAWRLRCHLRSEHSIEVPIHFQSTEGICCRDESGGFITGYARISHQIYNTVDDYVRLKNAVLQLVGNRVTCQMLSHE